MATNIELSGKRRLGTLLRIMAALAMIVGLALQSVGFVSTASATESHTEQWNGVNGANNLPCTGSLLWIYTGDSATAPTLTLNGVSYTGAQKGAGGYQFTTPGTGVTTSSTAFVTYTGPQDSNAVLTISHCTEDSTPSVDKCSNLEGNQSAIPSGYSEGPNGTCVEDSTPPVDVCSNLEGNQSEIPAGLHAENGVCVEDSTPPVDVCSNLEGNQSEIPAGLHAENGTCVEDSTPPVDVCSNLEGNQSTIPSGYSEGPNGTCVGDSTPPVDLCSNLVGNQSTIPAGQHAGENGTCVAGTTVAPCLGGTDNNGPDADGCGEVLGTDASSPKPSGLVKGTGLVKGAGLVKGTHRVKGTQATVLGEDASLPTSVDAGLAGQSQNGSALALVGQALLGGGLLLLVGAGWSGRGARRRGVRQS